MTLWSVEKSVFRNNPYRMPHMAARLLTVLLVAVLMPDITPAAAQTAPDPIRYTLRFPEPQTHYVEVTAAVPTARRPDVDLMMAVWTPGSYLVREYERNVEQVAATGQDGKRLTAEKSDKDHSRIRNRGAASLHV